MAVLTRLLLASALFLVASASASDSILDMINVQEVERLIAERKINSSKSSSFDHNLLEDDGSDDYFEQPIGQRRNTSSPEDLARQGEKLLRSSKDALLVTKREYLRRDWCKTEPLVMVVREEGCAPVSVLNHFCYGQCNSFYIPKSPKRKGKAVVSDFESAAFKSCTFCRPRRSSWVTVTLRCRRKKRVILRRKKVLRVKECKCLAEPAD